MNRIVRNHLPAFSLIELLVAMAVISIASAIVLVNLSAGRTAQYVSGAATEVEATVRGAQNFALTGAQNRPDTRPCWFRVTWGGTTYAVEYHYRDAAGVCTLSSSLSSRSLSDGVVFNGAGSFEFMLPHAALGSNQQIILAKDGVSQSVCVYMSGRILTAAGSTCP